jgi:hypothetical protein
MGVILKLSRDTIAGDDDVESSHRIHNSFDKATVIVDYVFGEIDDIISCSQFEAKQRLVKVRSGVVKVRM